MDNPVAMTTDASHGSSHDTTTINNTTTTTSPQPTTTPDRTNNTPTTTNNNDQSAKYTTTLPAKEPQTARLIYNNVNSLKTDCPAELHTTLVSLLEHDPTIIGLIETNRNWQNHDKTIKPLRTHINALQDTKATKIATAHCPETHTKANIYQPGGVAQLTLKPIQPRVQEVGSDKLGRWTWQAIRLNGERLLIVMTAYRTCPEPSRTSAQTTAWHQQYRALKKQNIPNPDLRKQFYTDLTRFIRQQTNKGHLIILGMDANTAHDDDNALDFMCDAELVDVFDDFLPNDRPPTYQRGRKQLDHLLCSVDLIPYWQNAFIMDPSKGPGDHSIFGGDLNLGALLNSNDLRSLDPTNEQSRNLVSTDVKASNKFLEDLETYHDDHNIDDRMTKLRERCNRTKRCTPNDERIFQILCKQLYESALREEAQCKRVGPRPWSCPLLNAGQTMRLARKEFYHLVRGGRPPQELQDRDSAIAWAKQNYATAKQMIRDVRCHARQLRQTHLELRAEEYAKANNTTKEKVVNAILEREQRSQVFRKLGYHIGGKVYNPLTKVLVPDDPTDPQNTSWTAIVEAEGIWEALLQHGKEHFSQAKDTPFVAGPIADHIGPFEFNECSKQILAGTFDVDSIVDNVDVRDIVKAMSYDNPSQPTKFDCTLTLDQLKDGFKRVNESTASSPTGMHYGIWKTLLKSEKLFRPYGNMIAFAFQWGVPPKQWEYLIQPIIEKDPGSPKVTRLQRISLVDAAMNMGFRIIFGHRMMKAATKNGSISEYQFGARSGHMAIGAVLLKRLSYDMARLTRSVLVAFDNDAQACYDRMIPSVSMHLAVREGVEENAAQVQLKLSKKMKYKMKSAFGVSPGHITSTDDNPLLGQWQGSASVGANWGLTSSLIFKVLKKRFQPTRFSSPQSQIYTERHGEAFVDDTTLWMIAVREALNIVVPDMEARAQTWERLLWTTGGALNLQKCFWYGVQWKWTGTGEPQMMKLDESPPLDIRLTSGANRTETVAIDRIDVSEGRRTLGVRLDPMGTDKDELTYRIAQGRKIRRRLLRAPTNKAEATTGFEVFTRPAIEYALPTTCFSKKNCEKIQASYFPTYLSKMGINQMTPAAVRSGPTLYGGMDKREVWTAQGSGHNKLLVSFLRKNDTVGAQLDVELRTLQLQAGVSWNVLSRDGSRVREYVDKCWATHTWEFNDGCGLTVQREDAPWLSPQREGDKFLLEDIANMPEVTSGDLKYVQRCRLFLQVTTLADICTSDGTKICEWATTYGKSNPRPPNFLYPNQERPTSHVWREFVRILRKCFKAGTNNVLRHPLGRWYKGRIQQEWPQVFSPETQRVYVYKAQTVRYYE